MYEDKQHPFDVTVTNVCKGVAVLLLLWHHLAPHCTNAAPWVRLVGEYGKVCVAIFLVLSGYGLMKATRQGIRAQVFRILRLYVNFWFVAAIFIVLSVLILDRTPAVLFARCRFTPAGGLIAELLGLHPYPAYNPTWWFINTILILYVLFPLLKWLLDRHWLLLVPVCVPYVYCVTEWYAEGFWIIPFVLGMVCAKYEFFESGCRSRWIQFAMALSFLVLVLLRHPLLSACGKWGLCIDGFLAIPVIFGIYRCVSVASGMSAACALFGRHSMNIFLMHTFLLAYFFPLFFARAGFFLGLVTLLLSSFLCSVGIEKCKRFCRVDALLKMVKYRVVGV